MLNLNVCFIGLISENARIHVQTNGFGKRQFSSVDPVQLATLTHEVRSPEPGKTKAVPSSLGRTVVSHVIFDFDGTLSWLRSGWPEVMTDLFAEYLPTEMASAENLHQLRREILSLNGKPSIYQMRRFCERAPDFRANPPEPDALLELYLRRLDETLRDRISSIARGEAQPGAFVIAGATPLLDELRRRGLRLIILSGTAEPEVRREVDLLGLKPYFGGHIYGSTPGKEFSKKDVIDRIIHDEGIEGAHLLSFGDGPVEIEFTRLAGGRAVGVASDEHGNGSGVIDPDKRDLLLRAGAEAIIPDYRNLSWILDTFFP